MHKSLLCAAAVAVCACAGQVDPSAIPCSGDQSCPTGSYCTPAGRCAALPSQHDVSIDSAAALTAGKTLKLTVHSTGGVSWSVQEPEGGFIDADGTYHAPAAPGTYHAIATSTADPGKSASVAIAVAPVPLKPALQADAVVTAGSASLAASVASPQAAMTFAWTIAGGQIGSGASTASILYTASAGPSLTLTVRATNTAGDFAESAATIQVAPVPLLAVISAPAIVTRGKAGLGAAVTSPQAGVTYSWTIAGGASAITSPATGASIVFTADAAATSLSLSCTARNAAGATAGPATATVSLVPAPVAAIALAAVLTQSKTGLVASVPVQAGSTYAWLLSGGAATSSLASDTLVFTADASSILLTASVTVTNAAGDATSQQANATLVAPVAPFALTLQAPHTTLTVAKAYAATFPPQAGITYSCLGTNAAIGAIVTAGQPYSVSFTPSVKDVNYSVACRGTNAAGDSTTSTAVTGLVAPAPAIPTITAPGSVTANLGYTASVLAQAELTYAWSIDSGGTLTAPTNTSTVGFTAGTGASLKLTCTVTNAAGDSATFTNSPAIVIVPLDATITAPGSVTQNKTGYSASVALVSGSTYDWSGSTGITFAGATNTRLVSFSATSATAVLKCKVTNSNLDSTTGTKTLTVVPLDATITASNTPVSENISGQTASVASATGSSYDWSGSTGIQIDSGSGTASIHYTINSSSAATLKCHVTNSLGDGLDGFKSLTVVPLDATISGSKTVTLNKTGRTASVQAFANTTYDWTASTGVTFDSGVTNQSTLTYTATSASAVLSCKTKNSNNDSQTATYNITAVPLDGTLTAPSSVTQNKDGYTASLPSYSTSSYDWTQSTGLTISGGSATSNSITFKVAGTSASIKVSTSNTAGDSTSTTQNLTVVPLDATITAAATVTKFKSGRSASVPNVVGSSYDWSGSTGIQFDSGAGTASISFTVTADSAALSCKVTNSLNDTQTGTKSLTVVPAVVATGIVANDFVLTTGALPAAAPDFFDPNSPAYSWTYSVDGGAQQTANTAGISLQPGSYPSTANLGLSEINAAGDGQNAILSPSITQAATGAQLIVGRLGGPGYLDGVGLAGRISSGFASLTAVPGAGNNFLFIQVDSSNGHSSLRRITPASPSGLQVTTVSADQQGNTFPYQAVAARTSTSVFACTRGQTDVYDFSSAPVATPVETTGCDGVMASPASDRYFTVRNNQIFKTVVSGSTGTPQLIAGTTSLGYVDAPTGPGTKARFSGNWGSMWAYDEFNLYVADLGNCAIRLVRYDAPSSQWQVTTIAGGPPCGYIDGGPGTAKLGNPAVVTGTGPNTLYVIDTWSTGALRKIVPNGGSGSTVSTVVNNDAMVRMNPESALRSSARGMIMADGTHAMILQASNAIAVDLSNGTAVTAVGKIENSDVAPSLDAPGGPGLAARVQTIRQFAQLGPNDYVFVDGYGSLGNSVRRLRLVNGAWEVSAIPLPYIPIVSWPMGIATTGPFPTNSFTVVFTVCPAVGLCVYQPAIYQFTTSDGVNWSNAPLGQSGQTSGGFYKYAAMPDSNTLFFMDVYNSATLMRATRANVWSLETVVSGGCVLSVTGGLVARDATTLYLSVANGICEVTYSPSAGTWSTQAFSYPQTAYSSGIALLDATHLVTTSDGTGTIWLWTLANGAWTAQIIGGQSGKRAIIPGPMSAIGPLFNSPGAVIGVNATEVLVSDDAENAIVDFKWQ